ncbi:MAG: acyl-CoA dehydrogenase family protein [Candidatus Rokubacteria bacterium]|nr:acyl-CoA dehydrogenase family protein [Candidatus Rokubacteria bacterium]
MQFALTEEQELMQHSVTQLAERHLPMSAVRQVLDAPDARSPYLWTALATEGYLGTLVPEEHGGAGLGCVEMACVLEPLGAALAPGPHLTSAVAAVTLLRQAGRPRQRADLLPRLAAGGTVISVAFNGAHGSIPVGVSAERQGSTWRLEGTQPFVAYGASADWLIVPAIPHGSSTPRFFLLQTGTPGLTAFALPMLDLTRRWTNLQLKGVSVPAEAELPCDNGSAVLERLGLVCAVMVAAEMLGGASRVLQMATTYARTREQFDRPIGSFQAIKHLLADMLVALEGARSAVYAAAWSLDADPARAPVDAAIAKAVATETYLVLAEQNIQIHGGIGFTWELDAHLYLRRAQADRLSYGTPEAYYEFLAADLDALGCGGRVGDESRHGGACRGATPRNALAERREIGEQP